MMLVAIAEHPHNFWLILGGLLLGWKCWAQAGFCCGAVLPRCWLDC